MLYNPSTMVRVGAKVLLLVMVVSWLAPAAMATYAQPDHWCCRRGGHHCTSSGPGSEPAFRSQKVHCRSCQAIVTAQQAPRPAKSPTVIAVQDEHPFIHEFSSAFRSQGSSHEEGQRAPPRTDR